MRDVYKILIALSVFVSGVALAPLMGLPAQGFNWQRYADVYTPAQVTIDHASGQPGSFFLVMGSTFTPNTDVDVSANGVLLGSLETDDDGELAFIVNSTGADEGSYFLEVTGAETGLVQFVLDGNSPLWPDPGTGDPVFVLPANIAIHLVRMPFIMR